MAILDEWIERAKADYNAAVSLNRRRKTPLPNEVCFHCQQCAEKYLKAYLVAQGVTPARIHDLEDLLHDCISFDVTLSALRPMAVLLEPYSVTVRYPGLPVTTTDARDAVLAVRKMRRSLRRKLGL